MMDRARELLAAECEILAANATAHALRSGGYPDYFVAVIAALRAISSARKQAIEEAARAADERASRHATDPATFGGYSTCRAKEASDIAQAIRNLLQEDDNG